MSHEIEILANGEAAFVSAREDAWHRLGVVTADALTAEDALKIAHLDNWNVRKTNVWTNVGGTTLRVPGAYATVRDNPITGKPDVLGTVGEQYTPVQNEALCEFLNTLTDESGAHFETAGSLRGGRHVFVTMKLPETMQVADTDAIDLYIAALNSHDGTAATRLLCTPVRIVCANTQHMALKRATSRFSIRHTTSAMARIEEARRALGLTWKYLEGFQAEAEKMIDAELTNGQFEKIIARVFPGKKTKSKRAEKIAAERQSTLMYLFSEAKTQENIRGTKWAGFQAITEYVDHYAPVRGADDEKAVARAERVLVRAKAERIKQTAYELLKV